MVSAGLRPGGGARGGDAGARRRARRAAPKQSIVRGRAGERWRGGGGERTSGKAVTAWRSAATVSQRLYTKSPRARETARSPLTRLNLTCDPAASIRAFSSGLYGLWSCESGTASPPRARTARESPVLAQTIDVGEMRHWTEVEPLWSCPDATSCRCCSSLSSAISDDSNAAFALPSKPARSGLRSPASSASVRCFGKWRAE